MTCSRGEGQEYLIWCLIPDPWPLPPWSLISDPWWWGGSIVSTHFPWQWFDNSEASVYLYGSRWYPKRKDCFGNEALENAKTTISPRPERIIWCYERWQHMFFEMIKTIPCFKIDEVIPSDIDSGEFLGVSTRNLIVLDDLMTQSGEDKRIGDLFSKGNHHRNLSVIYIVQNIFH